WSPTWAVSPITTPAPWSMKKPRPMRAPGWISTPVQNRAHTETRRPSTDRPRRVCSQCANRYMTMAWSGVWHRSTSSQPWAAGSFRFTARISSSTIVSTVVPSLENANAPDHSQGHVLVALSRCARVALPRHPVPSLPHGRDATDAVPAPDLGRLRTLVHGSLTIPQLEHVCSPPPTSL